MVCLHARKISICAHQILFTILLAAASDSLQCLAGQLTPGQTSGQVNSGRTAPGTPSGIDQNVPLQTVPSPDEKPGNGPVPNDNQALPPLVFESHGLEYEAITKEGITVMFAPLPSRLKDFNIIQITVSNGSMISWTVRPSDFVFIRQDGATLSPVSADEVVATLLQHADRDDVIKLQLLYENSIYALSNYRPTNGYEKRREAAMAQFVNRGFKAAAEASAITLVPSKLKSGDSTDGAVFFESRTKVKGLGAGRLVAHTCGQTFMFETYAELKKR